MTAYITVENRDNFAVKCCILELEVIFISLRSHNTEMRLVRDFSVNLSRFSKREMSCFRREYVRRRVACLLRCRSFSIATATRKISSSCCRRQQVSTGER